MKIKMKNLYTLRKCVLTSLLIFFALTSFSRSFYVSSSYTGSTSNGNFSTPWKSLANVQSNMSAFNPGDTISFKCGDYFSGTLNLSKSGLVNNAITFNSYGLGDKPKFIGTGSTISYLFYLYNKNYIVFDGLEITDTSISSIDRTQISKVQRAFGFDGTSNNNTIKNCKISLVGVGAYWVGPYNNMDHCDIGNLRMVVNNVGGDNDYGANPIVISSAYNSITYNNFHDCWANSYDYVYDGGAIEFYGSGSSNNFVGYNSFNDCLGVCENGSGSGGLIENNVFAYNKFTNNGSLFYINNGGTFSVTVSNMQFYNNVIVQNISPRVSESGMASMRLSTTTQGVVIFKNNVFHLSNGTPVARSNFFNAGQLIHENNIYKLSNNSTLNFTINPSELLTSQTVWTNTVSSDPSLWDFTPSASSQLINFGQNLGYQHDILNNSIVALPDAGVIEKSIIVVSPLVVTLNAGKINCNGGTTNVIVAATGGVLPYVGVGTFVATAGTHTYTVTDAMGASQTTTINVSEPSMLSQTLYYPHSVNISGQTVTVTDSASGGSGNYSYSIDGHLFQTTSVFDLVQIGSHFIKLMDGNGCTKTDSFNIILLSIDTPLTISIAAKYDVSCKGANNGYIEVFANGGKRPYLYSLNNTGFITSNKFSNLRPGNYSIVVKDSLNATSSVSVIILDGTKRCHFSIPKIKNNTFSVTAYPNPTSQSFALSFIANPNVEVVIEAFNILGKKVYQSRGSVNKFYQLGQDFIPGIYLIRVIQGEDVQTIKVVKQ